MDADCWFFLLTDAYPDIDHNVSLPGASSTRQGTSHVPVAADEVLGDVHRKWISAGKTELDNLTKLAQPLGSHLNIEQRDELRGKARATGQKYVELAAKAVFTIKPSKLRLG